MFSVVLAVLLLQDPMPEFDWGSFGLNLISAFVPVVTTLVIWAARKLLENVPRMSIPIIAVLLGTALDWLSAYIAGGVFSPFIGGLLGAAAVWIHQFISVWAEFGMKSRKETHALEPKAGY